MTRSILVAWRGVCLPAYTVLLYFGLVAGLFFGNRAAHAIGLPAGRVFLAQLVLIPMALAGARLLYVVFHLPPYRAAPRRVLRLGEGGADMFGGLPAAMLASLPVTAGLDLPFWRFWDTSALTLFGGMLIARFGCLLNGCCCGRPTDSRWGRVSANAAGVVCRRVPTQALEIAWTALVVALTVALLPLPLAQGRLFLVGAAAYGLGRFALDPGREERHPGIGPLTAHQGIYGSTVALCALGLALL